MSFQNIEKYHDPKHNGGGAFYLYLLLPSLDLSEEGLFTNGYMQELRRSVAVQRDLDLENITGTVCFWLDELPPQYLQQLLAMSPYQKSKYFCENLDIPEAVAAEAAETNQMRASASSAGTSVSEITKTSLFLVLDLVINRHVAI